MLNKIIGIIGTSIPILLGIGLLIFHLNINRDFDPFSMADYNIKGIHGLLWVQYFIYIFIGSLVVLFSVGLTIKSKFSITNKIASILILFTGILWVSFGILGREDGSDFYLILLLSRMILCLLLIIIGFLLLCNDLYQLTGSKKTQWIIYSFTITIIINSTLDFIMTSDYPEYLGFLSWILYFCGLGVVGFSILKEALVNEA